MPNCVSIHPHTGTNHACKHVPHTADCRLLSLSCRSLLTLAIFRTLLTLAVLWIAVYSRELSCGSHEDTLRSAPNVGAVALIPPRLIFSKRPCYLFIRQAKPLILKRESSPCRNPRHAKDSQGALSVSQTNCSGSKDPPNRFLLCFGRHSIQETVP